MARAAGLLGLLLLVSCTTEAAPRTPLPTPPASPASPATSATVAATPATAAAVHVFVVVLENTSYATALAQPEVAALAARYGLATNYHAVAHPSLPNYLALAAGGTFGIADDSYHRLPATGLGVQLDEQGLPWRAYFEGMRSGCFSSPPPYALKHNPFAYLGGACPEQAVDIARLAPDLQLPADGAPRLSWITPGLCNDGHDCGPAVASRYLGGLVREITASAAWRQGGVLFVTWDEDDASSGNHVPLLVIAPGGHTMTSSVAYDHYSLLATIEDLLGLPRLGHAAGAAPVTDLLPAR